MSQMQLNRSLIFIISLIIIACSGCLTETEHNEMQETAQQNSVPFMALGLGFHDTENWSGIQTRWMQDNATIQVDSPDNRIATLSLNAQSFYRNRTLEVYADDVLLTKTTIPTKGFVEIEVPVQFVKGTNALRFGVPEGCERPSDIKELNSIDKRCLSLAIQKINLSWRRPIQIRYLAGFHDIENWSGTQSRWMQANATLLVNSSGVRTAKMSLNAHSFYRNRTLEIFCDGAPVARVVVPTSFINISVPLQLAKGANTVRFQSNEGCEKPSDIKGLNSSDGRCLSVAVQNLIVT
jgi:hypothetical protein